MVCCTSSSLICTLARLTRKAARSGAATTGYTSNVAENAITPSSTPSDLGSSVGVPPTRRSASWITLSSARDRQSVVVGKSVSVRVGLGGLRIFKKKNQHYRRRYKTSL